MCAPFALVSLCLLVLACGGGGGGGGSDDDDGDINGGIGGEQDPAKEFFLTGASFGRAIFDVLGALDAVQPLVNPASLFETDPLTGVALAGFPKVLTPGTSLALLASIDFNQVQDPLTPQTPLVPRNAVLVLEFSMSIDPATLHFIDPPPGSVAPSGVISSVSTVQVLDKFGNLVAARGVIDPTDPKRLVLFGLAESGLGWDASPLQFDTTGSAVADSTGFLRVKVGVGFEDLAALNGTPLSDRFDGLGSADEALPFNPGNSKLDAIVLQTDTGQVTFNGFLPDLTRPRIVRPVSISGTIANIIGDTIEDNTLVPLPNLTANEGAGEWANALLSITSPSGAGTVTTQYVLSGNTNAASTATFVLEAGQSLAAVVSIGDVFTVSRSEFFEPIPGPLPIAPDDLIRVTVDAENHPRDPNDPADAFNSDLRYFVRMFDESGVELTSLWNPDTHTFLPVPPKVSFELTFSEAMAAPSFRPYETLTVRDASLDASDPAFQDMRIGKTVASAGGRIVRFEPVLEDQFDAGNTAFVGFGGTSSSLRVVLRTIPEASDLASLADSATPDVLAALNDIAEMGVRGCTDLGGRGLGLPLALLDQSDPLNFMLSPTSAGLGAFPPAIDFSFEFETLQTADLDYGAIVHRFMGQATTSIFTYPDGEVHDEVTQGVEYHDFPAIDSDGDGVVDRRFIYGPTLLEVGLNIPGRLTGASAATIEHLIDKFNAPKQSNFASPNGEDFLISVGFGLSVPINSGFGARFQHIYRAGDASPSQTDFQGAVLDLVGLAWAPFAGIIFNTQLDDLEILVGLSGANRGKGPNTNQTNGIPKEANSGLINQFDCNALEWMDNCNLAALTQNSLIKAKPTEPGMTTVIKKGSPYNILSSNLFPPANATGLTSGFFRYLDFPTFNDGIDPIFGRDDVFSFPYDSRFPMLIDYQIGPNAAVPSSLNFFSFSPGILSSTLPRFRIWSQGQHPQAHCVPNWTLGVGPGLYNGNQKGGFRGGEGGPLLEPGELSEPTFPPTANNGMPIIPASTYILPPKTSGGASQQPTPDWVRGSIISDDNNPLAGCITDFPTCNSDPDTNWYFANGMLINPLPNGTAYPGPTGNPPTFWFGYGVPLGGVVGTPGALPNSPPCEIPFNLGLSNQPGVLANEPSYTPNPASYGDNSRYYMMWKYQKRVSIIESPTVLTKSPEGAVTYLRPLIEPPLTSVDAAASLRVEVKAGSLIDFSIPQLDSGFVDVTDPAYQTNVTGFGNERVYVKFRASFGVAKGQTQPPSLESLVIPYVKVKN
jgi:hypothetical protein